jgi:enoyl-CoA hydratase/carnithine racemase
MDELLVERSGGVVTATMNRPAVRNALDQHLFEALRALFVEVGERPEDRVVVLTGAGGAFSSGGDLNPPKPTGADTLTTVRRFGETALAIHDCAKPVIAAVDGVAAGAGASLAFGCDLVLASATARFSLLFVRRGLSIDCGGSWLLPRLVGMHKAKEIALFGDWIDADEALRLGIVNRIFPAGELVAGAREWADRLAAQLPGALALIKRSLNRSYQLTMVEALEEEAHAQVTATSAPESRAALEAFRR